VGISYFLKKFFTSINVKVFIHSFQNYVMLVNEHELPIDILKTADIFLYQPIDLKWGIYSTDISIENNILSYLNKNCIKISFPYIYNSSYWALISPEPGAGLTGGGHENDINKYINKNIIEKLIDSGNTLPDIINKYKNNLIDFEYEKHFKKCIDILKKKEELCDVIVSDYILKYRDNELFFTQAHPSTAIFVHCSNQILNILNYNYKFSYDYPEQYFVGKHKLPHSKFDKQHYNFKHNIIINDNIYLKAIENIFLLYTKNIDEIDFIIENKNEFPEYNNSNFNNIKYKNILKNI
jgi:hypothetical protein